MTINKIDSRKVATNLFKYFRIIFFILIISVTIFGYHINKSNNKWNASNAIINSKVRNKSESDSLNDYRNLLKNQIYYFSSTEGDDKRDAQKAHDPKTPWNSLKKARSLKLNPGDALLFKRGDIFYGTLSIHSSGTLKNPIFIGAYGIGNKPVFSGGISIADWSREKKDIWKSKTFTSVVNLFIGNKEMALSRYPNKGFLTIDSVQSPNSFIVKDSISPIWIRANACIRTWDYGVLYRSIKSIKNNIITLDGEELKYGTLKNGQNLFLNNLTDFIRVENEWAYNEMDSILTLKQHQKPSNVEISGLETAILLEASNNIIIRDISIEKIVNSGIKLNSKCKNIRLQNINISEIGYAGIFADEGDSIVIYNCSVSKSGNIGIILMSSNSIVEKSTIEKIGINHNIISNKDIKWSYITHQASSVGLFSCGENNKIIGNIIDNIGYTAIDFRAPYQLILENKISNYCRLLEDGAGIYTWSDNINNKIADGSIIKKNIIELPSSFLGFHAIEGVYMDDLTKNCIIDSNIIINARIGIYLHNTQYHAVTNNIIFSPKMVGIYVLENQKYINTMKNNLIKFNKILVLSTIAPAIIVIKSDNNFISMANIDYNLYVKSLSSPLNIATNDITKKGLEIIYPFNVWENLSFDKNSKLYYSTNHNVKIIFNEEQNMRKFSIPKNSFTIEGDKLPSELWIKPFNAQLLIIQ
jgi:parallel beta-helix repeat protein